LKGRLAQLLTEGPSPNPRWLVKFDGQPHKDEEMYERSFGKSVSSAEDVEPPVTSSPVTVPSSAQKKVKTTVDRKSLNGKHNGTSSDAEPLDNQKSFQLKFQGKKEAEIPSDCSSTPESTERHKSGRVSARAERSRRRQAKTDEEIILSEEPSIVKKRILPPPTQPRKCPRPTDDEEVIKVKLLTGILYLYRGKHRRAEFVRRV